MVVVLLMASNTYATVNDTSNTMTTSYENGTVVTRENILDILDDFGIDHGEIIYSDEENDINYTVADLKEALLKVRIEAKEGELTEAVLQNENRKDVQPDFDTMAASTTK